MHRQKILRYLAIPAVFLTASTALATNIPGAPALAGDLDTEAEVPLRHSALKCWQEGRLILDENGWGIPTANLPGQVIKLYSLSKNNSAIYLFDMNRATCVLRVE